MLNRVGLTGRMALVLLSSALLAGVVVWFGGRPRAETTTQAAQPLPQPRVETGRILVSSRTILAGERITPEGYRFIDMSLDQRSDSLLADTPAHRAALSALIAPRVIPAGTAFVLSDLEGSESQPPQTAAEGHMSSLRLTKGMRAIAVPVTAETSVGGLLRHGDTVDIFLSYKPESGGMAIRTVLGNVRVVATDLITNTSEGIDVKSPPKIITVELPPEAAKVLTLAQEMGDISLVLRDGETSGGPIIFDDLPVHSMQFVREASGLNQANDVSVSVLRGRAVQTRVLNLVAPAAEPVASGSSPQTDTPLFQTR